MYTSMGWLEVNIRLPSPENQKGDRPSSIYLVVVYSLNIPLPPFHLAKSSIV